MRRAGSGTPAALLSLLLLLLLLSLLLLLQTFQLDPEHEAGGEWYTGSIIADARISRPHAEVTADLFGCGGLWERYKVQWDAEGDASEEEDHDDDHHAGGGKEEVLQRKQQQRRQGVAAAAAAAAGDHRGEAEDPAAAAAAAESDGDDDSLSPWELYAAGQSSEAVLAVEHATQLTGEQVGGGSYASWFAGGAYAAYHGAPRSRQQHVPAVQDSPKP
jgi:hypothetical protein